MQSVFAPFLVLSVIFTTTTTTISGKITQPSSMDSNILPNLNRLTENDARTIVCLFMRNPPSECYPGTYFETAKKRDGNLKTVQELLDENDRTACEGRNCDRLRSSVAFSRDEPPTGPKRFYNNW